MQTGLCIFIGKMILQLVNSSKFENAPVIQSKMDSLVKKRMDAVDIHQRLCNSLANTESN